MLVFDSIKNQFPDLKKDQIFLSGLKELDRYTENHWDWTIPGKPERINFLNFLKYVKQEYGFDNTLMCCLFILIIFPRKFFDMYTSVENKTVGMLEYKIPIYSQIFHLPFYKKDMGVWWYEKKLPLPLNAVPQEIVTSYIQAELAKIDGWRIFHPYYKMWKR